VTAGHSVSSEAQFNHQLQVTTSQFGVAETIGLKMAATAATPDLWRTAARTLAVVGKAENNAWSALAGLRSRVSGTASATVARAELEVIQGHALAVSVLANLAAQADTGSTGVQDQINGATTQAGVVLTDIVDGLTADSGCQADVPQLAAGETAHVQASLDGESVGVMSHTVDAGGSLLGQVTSDEVADVTTEMNSSGSCQSAAPSDSASASAQGSVVTSLGFPPEA
jgi:hypothetical protein